MPWLVHALLITDKIVCALRSKARCIGKTGVFPQWKNSILQSTSGQNLVLLVWELTLEVFVQKQTPQLGIHLNLSWFIYKSQFIRNTLLPSMLKSLLKAIIDAGNYPHLQLHNIKIAFPNNWSWIHGFLVCQPKVNLCLHSFLYSNAYYITKTSLK